MKIFKGFKGLKCIETTKGLKCMEPTKGLIRKLKDSEISKELIIRAIIFDSFTGILKDVFWYIIKLIFDLLKAFHSTLVHLTVDNPIIVATILFILCVVAFVGVCYRLFNLKSC